MTTVEKEKDFLNALIKAKRGNRDQLIASASKSQINSICEIIINILRGNLAINEKLKKKLSKRKESLRELVKRKSLTNKKYLLQKGGFIQFLIPAIITGLSSIVDAIISK